MNSSATTPVSRGAAVWSLVGLVLLTVNLRAAITGIAPVLGELRDVFGLSGAEVGVLTTLPVLCLGAFAASRRSWRGGSAPRPRSPGLSS